MTLEGEAFGGLSGNKRRRWSELTDYRIRHRARSSDRRRARPDWAMSESPTSRFFLCARRFTVLPSAALGLVAGLISVALDDSFL